MSARESITIADIALIGSGDTMRRAEIGDTLVTVWVTIERQIVEYKCVFKYRGIVEHFKLPLHIHHLDRAMEHACNEVIERQARQLAARAPACVDCGVELEDPTGPDDADVCERCAAFEQMQEGSFS